MKPTKINPKKNSLISAFLVSTTMVLPVALGVNAAAAAQTEISQSTYVFDISARSIADGVSEIGGVTGWRIAYAIELPAIEGSRIIQGRMTVPAAVDMLLRGTGLTYRVTGENSLILIDPSTQGSQSENAVTDPVLIETSVVQSDLPSVYAGGQVATGGRLGMLGNTDIMDAPVSITSYTSQKIADQQAETIADVLQNDPSVRAPNAETANIDTYQIRGFGVNLFNTGEVSFNGSYGVAPTYRVLSGMAERIEVVKGPNALLNGMSPTGAVGGAINIVPKRAGDEDLNRVSADYGRGEQVGGNVDISRRFGDEDQFGVRFNGGYHNGDTYLDRQTKETSLGALALDYKGERLRASIDLIDQRENLDAPAREVRVDPGITMPGAPDGSTNLIQTWEWSDAVDRSGLVQAEYDAFDTVTVFGSFGGGRTEVDRLFGTPTITNSAGDYNDKGLSYRRFQTDRWSVSGGVRGEFETAEIKHKATFEATRYEDVLRQGVSGTTVIPSSNIYAAGDIAPVFVSAPATKPKTSETELTGFALSDTMAFWDDQVLVTLGARHQSIAVDSFRNGAISSSYDDSVITPMAGVVVKPNENVSLYANYIEGLSPGEIAPASAANSGEATSPYVAKQLETGVKLDFGSIGGSLSVFQITQQSGDTDPDTNVFSADNEQRNRGLEINVFGEVTPSVRLLGGVMFLDSEINKSADPAKKGKRPVGTPDMQINLTGEWDTPFAKGLTLSSTLTHTSQQFVDAANTQDIPDWTTLDLGLRYKTSIDNTPITLRATVQNVTDEKYWSGVNQWRFISLGAPRTAFVSVTADF